MTFENWFQLKHPEFMTSSMTAVLELAQQGATVPFIARYRKERTQGLNEVQVQMILDAKERWDLLIQRKNFILKELTRQNQLTPELKEKILATFQSEILEDLYLPYKQKRQTKAVLAREAGLESLADWIWNCGHGIEVPHPGQTLQLWAFTYRNEVKGVLDVESAIAGAQDILVERLTEDPELRQCVRSALFEKGMIKTRKSKKAKNQSKFENYFEYQEAISSLKLPQNSHRYLAMKRGWMEDELILTIEAPETELSFEQQLIPLFLQKACSVTDSPGAEILANAAKQAYCHHILPSIENEVHKLLKEVADQSAIQVFVENAKKKLLAPPFGPKTVLGIDPGLRTGCKMALVDRSGQYLEHTVFYLNQDTEKLEAGKLLLNFLRTQEVEGIAVGNGTAGRETEQFVRTVCEENQIMIPIVMVNESGASVYSASEVGREEFPNLDLTVRGAISIARRLQDPLSELVKIDPRSIGVGQYQHDLASHVLKRHLTLLVESCVNQVGVNLNTASYHLLSYVSGIGPNLARAIVEYRSKNGLFHSRQDLHLVPRLNQKIFEQAAGFLRIPESQQPLDHTGVHPEHYATIESFAQSCQKTVQELMHSGIEWMRKSAENLKKQIGEFTFADILLELEKPGRDPRKGFRYDSFRSDIHELKDLKLGMICPGIVTNVTNFGAFVDIGVHQDGLVHVSQIGNTFIKDPQKIVSPGDWVQVKVLDVNLSKKQISLSIRQVQTAQKTSMLEGSQKKKLSKTSALKPQDRSQSMKKSMVRRGKKEAFNNPFSELAALRSRLKTRS